MTDIRPANPDHSIIEVIFAFQFATDLSERQLSSVASLDLPDLPEKQEASAIQFKVQEGGEISSTHSALAEVQFSHEKSDGRRDWVLKVARRYATVSCFDYDQWERVWPKAKKFLSLIAPETVGDKSPLSSVGLQYIDHFVYEGEEDQYTASDLFNPDSPYLTKQALTTGTLWHVHQGWFDATNRRLDRDCQILNRLNINTSSEKSEHRTILDHQMAFIFSDPVGQAALLTEGEESQLAQIMDFLHQANKDVLRRLLTRAMLEQIGMGEGDEPNHERDNRNP